MERSSWSCTKNQPANPSAAAATVAASASGHLRPAAPERRRTPGRRNSPEAGCGMQGHRSRRRTAAQLLRRLGLVARQGRQQPSAQTRTGRDRLQRVRQQPQRLHVQARRRRHALVGRRAAFALAGAPLQLVEREQDRVRFGVFGFFGHSSSRISARSAVRSFCIANRVRVFTVPQRDAGPLGDLPLGQALEKSQVQHLALLRRQTLELLPDP